MLPGVDVVEADIHDEAALAQLMRGVDAAINLVGVLHSRRGRSGTAYGPDFERAHVELPRKHRRRLRPGRRARATCT